MYPNGMCAGGLIVSCAARLNSALRLLDGHTHAKTSNLSSLTSSGVHFSRFPNRMPKAKSKAKKTRDDVAAKPPTKKRKGANGEAAEVSTAASASGSASAPALPRTEAHDEKPKAHDEKPKQRRLPCDEWRDPSGSVAKFRFAGRIVQPAKFGNYGYKILTVLLSDTLVDVRVMSKLQSGLGWAATIDLGNEMSYDTFVERLGSDTGGVWYQFEPCEDLSRAVLKFADKSMKETVLERMTDGQMLDSLMAYEWRETGRPALYDASFAERKKKCQEAEDEEKKKKKAEAKVSFSVIGNDIEETRFDLSSGATILDLKLAVKEKFDTLRHVNADHFYLMLGNEELYAEAKTLGDVDELPGSFLKLVVPNLDQKPSFPPQFDVGNMLLVVDKYNETCRSIILAKRSGQVFIRYPDWSAVWNEWIDIDSPRIHTSQWSGSPSTRKKELSALVGAQRPGSPSMRDAAISALVGALFKAGQKRKHEQELP